MKVMEMVIELHDDGSIRIQAPLQNKPLCNMVVDLAKQFILNFDPSQEQPVITPSPIIVPGQR